jgi:mRNA interferase MazF
MLTSGDVVDVALAAPSGRDAGFDRPAIVVTAQRVLDGEPNVVHVVPLTTTIRGFDSEVTVEPDRFNGLERRSAAQCHQIRAVAAHRIGRVRGSVGSVGLLQVRDMIGLLLDIPG